MTNSMPNLVKNLKKRRHDPIDACTMEDGKVAELFNPPKPSNVPRSYSDEEEDDEVFPGEVTIWT